MRRFLVDALGEQGHALALGHHESHHMLHVLRATPGDEAMLFDGKGRQARARLVGFANGLAELVQLEPPAKASPEFPLWLLLGVLKQKAMDAALRMATEAGATDIQPILLQRSVARGDRNERWQRIGSSATAQCGRADVPRVHPMLALPEALDRLPTGVDLRVAVPGADRAQPANGSAAVLVGPEGGLTAAEVQLALSHGARTLGLSRWVLRADTATAVAIALVAPI